VVVYNLWSLDASPEEQIVKGKPYMLLLDSMLVDDDHMEVVKDLKSYLEKEYHDKKKKILRLSDMQVSTPAVPQQTNSSDCALYLLHYIELIFGDFKRFLFNVKGNLDAWFAANDVLDKRKEIASLIHSLADDDVQFPDMVFESKRRRKRGKAKEEDEEWKADDKMTADNVDQRESLRLKAREAREKANSGRGRVMAPGATTSEVLSMQETALAMAFDDGRSDEDVEKTIPERESLELHVPMEDESPAQQLILRSGAMQRALRRRPEKPPSSPQAEPSPMECENLLFTSPAKKGDKRKGANKEEAVFTPRGRNRSWSVDGFTPRCRDGSSSFRRSPQKAVRKLNKSLSPKKSVHKRLGPRVPSSSFVSRPTKRNQGKDSGSTSVGKDGDFKKERWITSSFDDTNPLLMHKAPASSPLKKTLTSGKVVTPDGTTSTALAKRKFKIVRTNQPRLTEDESG